MDNQNIFTLTKIDEKSCFVSINNIRCKFSTNIEFELSNLNISWPQAFCHLTIDNEENYQEINKNIHDLIKTKISIPAGSRLNYTLVFPVEYKHALEVIDWLKNNYRNDT